VLSVLNGGHNCVRRQRGRGIASVWFAVVGLLLAAMFAFAVDSARYYYSFHQLQVAADAAALSALDYMPSDVSRSRASAILTASKNRCADLSGVTIVDNPSNDYGGDVVYGFYNTAQNTFTRGTSNANAARVRAQRTDSAHGGPVKFIFRFFASQDGSSQIATATAFLNGPQPGLLLLDKYGRNPAQELRMQGGTNTQLTVTNGSILVNSGNTDAADLHGTISATSLATVGGVNSNSNTLTPTQVKLTQPVPDPVAPFVSPLTSYGTPVTVFATLLDAGYYPNGLPSGVHTLKQGTYILGGPWMPDPSTGSSYTGDGVTFYLLNTTGPHNFSNMSITAPTGGPFPNIAIYQDTANVPSNPIPLTFTGNPSFNIQGTIYMPYTNLSISGNTTISAFGSEVILNLLDVGGSAKLSMNAVTYYQVIGTQRTLINTVRTVFQ